MAKHRSIWGYWARCAPWMRHEFPTWRQAFFYRARHRGVYKPPAPTTKPHLIGECSIRIVPNFMGFNLPAAVLNDMVKVQVPKISLVSKEYTALKYLGTDPDLPWVVPRD